MPAATVARRSPAPRPILIRLDEGRRPAASAPPRSGGRAAPTRRPQGHAHEHLNVKARRKWPQDAHGAALPFAPGAYAIICRRRRPTVPTSCMDPVDHPGPRSARPPAGGAAPRPYQAMRSGRTGVAPLRAWATITIAGRAQAAGQVGRARSAPKNHPGSRPCHQPARSASKGPSISAGGKRRIGRARPAVWPPPPPRRCRP